MTLSDRQLEFPEQTLAGLTVKRLAWVPATGGDFARYLEVLTNPGSRDVTTTVSITGNLGSDSSTFISSTSSGDTILTTSDTWFATDDVDSSGDPSLAHVFQGSSAMLAPTTVSLSSDNIDYSWNVTVPAGGQVAFLHFAVQKPNEADSWTEAMRLVETPDDVMVGLDDYLDSIQNFGIATPGAPRVHFMGPYTADEGSPINIDVMVEDLEGDTFDFSWDLNDDETFGDMPGETSYTIPAGTTDEPGSTRVGISATDSNGNNTQRYRTITINNLDPTITSHPPLTTGVGADFRYTVEASDPAGDLDPFTYSLAQGPDGMSISPDGIVQWTPGDSDVTPPGSTLTIRVSVDDGDGGTAEQSWEMTVSPNHAPTPPMQAFPIDNQSIADDTPRLAAANSSDLDLDTLTYYFEIDTVDTFDSPDLRQSGPLDETTGFTAWQITDPLPLNHLYYWRVWANDGTVDSEKSSASFYLVRDPSLGPPDAGTPDAGTTLPSNDDGGLIPGTDAGTRTSGGGCSVGANGRGSTGWVLGLIGLALVLRRRRR